MDTKTLQKQVTTQTVYYTANTTYTLEFEETPSIIMFLWEENIALGYSYDFKNGIGGGYGTSFTVNSETSVSFSMRATGNLIISYI